MSAPQPPSDRVCIIGAGPAGLSTARALKLEGIDFEIFEKHSDVGGIWDPDNPGSPMYESAHFISSKTMSGHFDHPMPDDFPDYPSHRQVLRYIRSFADTYGLRKHIRFQSPVESTRYINGKWELNTPDGTIGGYRWLVAANGVTWFPKRPPLEGEDDFEGDIIHSVDYHKIEQVRGRRVLVVGAGNSGVDIACDAASAADSTLISLRRGYHFLPKHLFGMPIDVFGEQSKWLPIPIQQQIMKLTLRLLLGDLRKLGLPKPDHRILESHPIINSQLLHHLQHGDVRAKPDIDRLEEKGVVFSDGSRAEIDLVILATGFSRDIPYLPNGILEFEGGHPKAHLRVFPPGHPELFLNGFIETNGGAYKFFDRMAQMIAKGIKAQIDDGDDWQRLQSRINGPSPDLSGGVHYVDSGRHHGYVNAHAYTRYTDRLRRDLNWPEFTPGMFDRVREPTRP